MSLCSSVAKTCSANSTAPSNRSRTRGLISLINVPLQGHQISEGLDSRIAHHQIEQAIKRSRVVTGIEECPETPLLFSLVDRTNNLQEPPMLKLRTTAALLTIALVASTASAQIQRRVNPASPDPEVDPTLPNVLLIVDSISIGYHVDAREALAGKANVYQPNINFGPTTRGLEQIDQWLGDREWDVVHWNFRLHDLKYMGPNGENLADPAEPSSHPQVAIDAYQANIKKLTERIKKQAKIVIWRETTTLPEWLLVGC
jgi:hypothetical protein